MDELEKLLQDALTQELIDEENERFDREYDEMTRPKTKEESLRSHWQTSDKVRAEAIQGVTKKCPRFDCCISARITGTQLMGTRSYYNKLGWLVVEDPNAFTAHLNCWTCHTGWEVNQRGEVLTEVKCK